MSTSTRAASGWLTRLDRTIELLVQYTAATLVLIEIFILLAGVVWRYALDNPLVWVDELAEMPFLWLVSLGTVIALFRGEHMRMADPGGIRADSGRPDDAPARRPRGVPWRVDYAVRGAGERAGRAAGQGAIRPAFVSGRGATRRERRAVRDVAILALGIGLFLPPFGVGFYQSCLIGRTSSDHALGPVVPYLMPLIAALVLVATVPWISTGFLP